MLFLRLTQFGGDGGVPADDGKGGSLLGGPPGIGMTGIPYGLGSTSVFPGLAKEGAAPAPVQVLAKRFVYPLLRFSFD